MKLLILAQGYPSPANPITGAFHRPQVAELTKLGFDVTLVAPVPFVPPGLTVLRPRWKAYSDQPNAQTDGDAEILRPRYLSLPRENRWLVPHLAQYAAIRRLGLPRPDVIQAFFAYPTGLVAQRLARAWKVPAVISLLGDDVTFYPRFSSRTRRYFEMAVTGADAVLANGSSLARATQEMTGIAPRVLPIGIALDRFAELPDKAEARRRLALPADGFLALFVGFMVPQKGIAEMASALEGLRSEGVSGIFVGAGPMQDEMAARPGIRCVGSRPADEVALYMRAADVLILPSHREGLPTVIVEAGAAGLPVIGSDVPGILDIIGGNCGLSFRVGDAAALAAAIREARDNPAAAAERAARLRERVFADYDIAATTAKLAALYRELTGAAECAA